MPKPGVYSRDDAPDFHEDEDLSIIFTEGIIYQESLDGSRVAITLDLPGIQLSSLVKPFLSSTQKRTSAPNAPSTLTPLPKGRCSKRSHNGTTPQRGPSIATQGVPQ